MASFEAGSWVWVPDEKDMFLPGKVVKTFKPGEEGHIKYEDGKSFTIPAKLSKELIHMDEAALQTYDNMIKLNDLNEPVILHNLRQRFLKDHIYTYVSSILIACNPFKLLPIYTPEIMDKYKDGGGRVQPPHIFAIADNSYRNLLADFRDQAVVISGESGAGKTETMKLVLQFLADVSGRAQKQNSGGEKQESLEQQILKSNPVMEAFGNAKTTRNNNSSRFGKWTEIKFNRQGAIVGGSIINYLLEKSRIPFQATNERNFHIFYQLLAGGEVDPALKKSLKLRDAEEFRYMNQSGVTTVDTINDEKDWIEMSGAMDVLNMTTDEKEQTFRCVAACLHIGNIEFDRDPKGQEETDSKVKNLEQMNICAELLKVTAASFTKCLCYKKITRPGSKSVTYAHYSIMKAGDARDATSKALYGKLFDWLILKINRALSGLQQETKADQLTTIGVLDIFGFESFQTNSFEQLCINYCNEKLQFHFNEYIFKLEQSEYASEGIPVDLIEFKDNQPTLDMLEQKGTGIFSMIDEEISVPKGTDETMLKKILTKHAKHPNFAAPKPKDFNANLVFVVIHYAGAVPYNVTAFLEKNKDALHEDIIDCLCASKCPLISKLLADEGSGDAAGKAKKKQPTLGFQFKTSLEGLMVSLYRCEPHFVRCMKSNHQKRGNLFESDMMMAQLRYCGLLEVARIRKIGFPVRKRFDEFIFRYRCLDLINARDHVKLCNSLEKKGVLKPRQWAIGHTKVFMRNKQQEEMEEAREHALKDVVKLMQAAARRFIARCRYIKYQAVLKSIREAIKKRTEEALEAALSEAPELPWSGDHLPDVRSARKLKERLEEERRVTVLCTDAIKARDLNELKAAVKAADEITFESDVTKKARELRDLMEKEKAAIKKLKDAVAARSLEDLTAAIEHGATFKGFVTDTDTYKQAVSLKERIEAENAARKALKRAMKDRSLEALTAALVTVSELGLDEDIVKEGQALKEELEEQARAVAALKEAMTERVLESVQAALKRCKKVGVPADGAEYTAGKELEAKLIEEKETEDELNASADAREAPRIEKALKKATKMGMPETPGVKKATKMLERLKAEDMIIELLKKAIKAKKAPGLLSAINKANELGLSADGGPGAKEMADAKEALMALGAQSEALLRLEEAVNASDLERIDAGIKECEKMGLGEEEQITAARDAKKRIAKQNKAATALKKAVEGRSREEVKAALVVGEELNLAKRFEDIVESATKLLELMDKEDALVKQMTSCAEQDDEDGLDDAIDKAKSFGCAEHVHEIGAKCKAEVDGRKEFNRKLARLLEDEDRDKDALVAMIEEAKEMGIKGGKVEQAVQVVAREKGLKETRKALKKAQKGADEKGLAEALEKAISLGMKGEEVDKAKKFQARLEEEKELSSGVRAALKGINVKAESNKGVRPADLEPLLEAMEEARNQGLSDDSPFMKQAREAQARIESVLVITAEVAKALESDSLRVMKRVLDKAEDADLASSSLVKKLRARLREMEKARSKAAMDDDDGGAEAVPSLDDEEMKRLREEKMKKASHPKYAFVKFPKIRSPDEFARGVLLNKKKVKMAQLRWQPGVIPTSILDYANKDLAKTATKIHRNILGYTGDKSMSFPATLAQDILTKGLELPDLVDEIYLQLCKHLTHNPRPESAVRGWQIMCMCVGTFPPSRDFENFLLNYILEHKNGAGAIGNYARYSLRRLEGILNSGPSGFVPSVDEIQAYKERPPILATIELVDGIPLTEDLPITPDLNVGKVLDICNHFLELTDPRMQYFGIFVEDVEDPDAPVISADSEDAPPYAGLPKTPRPLQSENFMGDVVTVKVRQNQPFKFVFKRKIFLKNLDAPSEDRMFERLVYLQAVDEIIAGNLPVESEDEVAKVVAQAMVVEFGDEMPDNEDDLIAADVMEYVPKSWRDQLDAKDVASKVLAHRDVCIDMEPEVLQSELVNSVRDHPLYGTCFFHVRKHRFPDQMESYPDECIIALNSEGLHFLNEDRETLSSFGYADIYRWGGSSTSFSIIIWNAETQDTDDVSMYTCQAADMASLILDYITKIMESANDA